MKKGINKKALTYAINAEPHERLYLCEKDFSLFMVYYFLDYVKYPFAQFHYDWFDYLNKLTEKEITELALIGFRESAKTSFAKIYLIYLICYKKKKYINVDSFDKENAERILFDIVTELQQNPRLVADFGQLFSAKRSKDMATQKRVNNFVTNNGVRVEAHSTQESIRGRVHGSQRPDFILFDDIETDKTRESQAYTKQVQGHLNEALTGVASDDFTAIYLGNYITEYGNIEDLRKRAKRSSEFVYSQIAIVEEGKPTWPSKYVMTNQEAKETGKVSIEKLKERHGSQVFMAEFMNQPIDESTQEFKKTWFQQVTPEELRKIRTNCFIIVDTALSEKEQDDDTGIAIIWVDRENNWYVRAYPKRVNPSELIDHLFDLHREYKPSLIGIERTMYSTAIKTFMTDKMRERNVFLPIRELEHRGRKKEVRIRGLIPRYENKTIWHMDSPVLEEQLIRFPQGQHDDVADALAYGLDMCFKPFSEDDFSQIDESSPLYDDIGI